MCKATDREIYETLMDELNWDEDVCAVLLRASVRHAVVTLEGSVPSLEQRLRAEAIVRMVPGVRDVRSRLQVGQPGRVAEGPSLVERIHTVLSGLGCVDADEIQVRVDGGWIRLSGLVGSEERRRYLIWLLQKSLGIREVSMDYSQAWMVMA